MFKTMTAALVVVFALSTAACSGTSSATSSGTGGTSSAASSNPTGFCDAFCQRNAACDSDVDVQTCTTGCNDALLARVQKLRSDVIASTVACFEASDCRAVLTSKSFVSDCIEEAAVSVAPSAAAKTFCGELSSSMDRCDHDLDRAGCLQSAKVYSDEALAKAQSCTQKSCSSMATCVVTELDLD